MLWKVLVAQGFVVHVGLNPQSQFSKQEMGSGVLLADSE
jgi:hypothetical protein